MFATLIGMRNPVRVTLVVLFVFAFAGVVPATAAVGPVAADSPSHMSWVRPVDGRVVEPFRAPAHRYGPGHRGADLAAPVGTPVVAPASGVVAFSGTVAGRPLLTIDHGDGFVTTLEPVLSDVQVGTQVEPGMRIATVATGGHSAAGTVHLGLRLHGEYVDPMRMYGASVRAVLLPCC